ncbi:MAG: carboxyl transferase domain-containing protein, partial [Pseudomonadota bacterium]
RFAERGQLTPRERLSRLLDPGLPWLSIGNLAGYLADGRPEEKSIPGGPSITGIGFIKGVRCVVCVDDSGIAAGALTNASVYRLIRGQEIALQQKLPFIHLVESAGGDLLNYRVEGFIEGGRMFGNLAKLSKAGLPVITILHGSATAGGAYMPGMSDYVIGVKDNGKAFLAGPPLLKAATGEVATDGDLGGAEMHATVSGLVEHLADNDSDAVLLTREVVERLGWNENCARPGPKGAPPPIYDPEELAGVTPVDYRVPVDVREIVARVVDGSDMLDFKPRFGATMVCLQASVLGRRCGILGNNGPIDPDGANKATQFLQLMDQSDTPVVFLHNVTGYMVGTAFERAGMIKHGSKLIQAVQNIEVPRISLMIGGSFGAGNYGMCGRGFDPDFAFTWPNAASGVMGGEQAAKVMEIVAEGQAQATGKPLDRDALGRQSEHLVKFYDDQSSAFVVSGRCMDDGMIDPRDTRNVLGFLLATVWEARHRDVRQNSFGIARM